MTRRVIHLTHTSRTSAPYTTLPTTLWESVCVCVVRPNDRLNITSIFICMWMCVGSVYDYTLASERKKCVCVCRTIWDCECVCCHLGIAPSLWQWRICVCDGSMGKVGVGVILHLPLGNGRRKLVTPPPPLSKLPSYLLDPRTHQPGPPNTPGPKQLENNHVSLSDLHTNTHTRPNVIKLGQTVSLSRLWHSDFRFQTFKWR